MATNAEIDKYQRVQTVLSKADIIRFQGGTLWRTTQDTPETVPRTNGYERFSEEEAAARFLYTLYPGISKTNLKNLYHEVIHVAPDRSNHAHLIAFGDKVWNTTTLDWEHDNLDYVYSSNVTPNTNTAPAKAFLLQLADGDPALAQDYAQSIAPLFMSRRPSGVVWFVGDGANGKSSLLKTIWLIIGKHLESMTLASIEDGRATPSLRGILGNICKESSESRVEDSEKYKALGTHESFTERLMRTHELITIDGNIHTIFNANTIPLFADKTKGARRRTLVVPFPAHFHDDPTFDARTFSNDFLGGLLTLILEATHTIRDNGYKYNWSEATLRAKADYDSEVNSAEAFLVYLTELGVVGFKNYNLLRISYENWCAENGLNPLMLNSLRKVFKDQAGADSKVIRTEDKKTARRFVFPDVDLLKLTWLDNGYAVPTPDEEKVVEQMTLDAQEAQDEW